MLMNNDVAHFHFKNTQGEMNKQIGGRMSENHHDLNVKTDINQWCRVQGLVLCVTVAMARINSCYCN